MIHKINYADTKILKPDDRVKLSNDTTPDLISKHYAKPVRGHVFIEDSKGNVIDTPNLVLLKGREFLTQILANVYATTDLNYLNYRITHFGVGSGGADTADIPSKVGPFDNDTELNKRQKIFGVDTNDAEYTYLDDGYLKRITADDGSIEVISEDHTFTKNNITVTLPAYTTIKYTMVIRADEMYKANNTIFSFNEAALYAVQYDSDYTKRNIPAKSNVDLESSRYSPNKLCFAKFTTATKHIEPNDSIKITLYIML